MAVSLKQILSAIPALAAQLLPNMAGGISRILSAGTASRGLKGKSLTYPGLTADFDYPVNFVGGDVPFLNASVNRELAAEGALAQTLDNHNEALRIGGEPMERALRSWWPGEDTRPRVEFTPGSSAVSGVKILPNNKIAVQWKNRGKWYTYRGGSNPRESSEIAKELLTAPSIGRAVAARNGKDGVINPNLGWFGRAHYDPNY